MILTQTAPYLVDDYDPPLTADSAGYAIDQNGMSYALKTFDKHPLLPPTEAFCEALAVACHLPQAQGAWLMLPDGTQCYGSLFEGGVSRPIPTLPKLLKPLVKGMIRRKWQALLKPKSACAIYAFDLFVFNNDRHFNNYLYQEQRGNFVLLSIDYSRAFWIWSDDPALLPPPVAIVGTSTQLCQRDWSQWINGFDLQTAKATLQSIRNIPKTWVSNTMTLMPAGWVPPVATSALLNWWGSANWSSRIDAIEQGLTNGNLL